MFLLFSWVKLIGMSLLQIIHDNWLLLFTSLYGKTCLCYMQLAPYVWLVFVTGHITHATPLNLQSLNCLMIFITFANV